MIFEPVSRAQVLQIAQAGINDISRLAAQQIDKHMVLAIIRAGLQVRFEAGQNVPDFLRFKIPCTADGAAVRATCSQIAMPLAIQDARIPRAKVVGFVNVFSLFQAFFKFRGNRRLPHLP